MGSAITLLEESLIPLREELARIEKPFNDEWRKQFTNAKDRHGNPSPVSVGDISKLASISCSKTFKCGQDGCHYGCDGGELQSYNNALRDQKEKIDHKRKIATASIRGQINSAEKELLELKEKAQLPILRKQIISDSQKLDALEQKYNLFTNRPTLAELKPSTVPEPVAEPVAEPVTEILTQPQIIMEENPEIDYTKYIIAGGVGIGLLLLAIVWRLGK